MPATRLLALVFVLPALVTPAFAMTGRQAAGACIDRGPACKSVQHKDGELVFEVNNGGTVTVVRCPSATADCHIVTRVGAKPPLGGVEKVLGGSVALSPQ